MWKTLFSKIKNQQEEHCLTYLLISFINLLSKTAGFFLLFLYLICCNMLLYLKYIKKKSIIRKMCCQKWKDCFNTLFRQLQIFFSVLYETLMKTFSFLKVSCNVRSKTTSMNFSYSVTDKFIFLFLVDLLAGMNL